MFFGKMCFYTDHQPSICATYFEICHPHPANEAQFTIPLGGRRSAWKASSMCCLSNVIDVAHSLPLQWDHLSSILGPRQLLANASAEVYLIGIFTS